MTPATARGRTLAILAVALVAGCGASTPDPAAPTCEGVLIRGACWVGNDGITLSVERVGRVVARAEAYWGFPEAPLNGWRVEFRRSPTTVDGTRFDGYCWREDRTIVVTPFVPDCFERSAIFHELGHAWGFGESDPRMSGEWPVIRAAMRDSGWGGCSFGDEEEDDD